MRALAIIIMLAASSAHAQFMDGNDLYDRMNSTGVKLVSAQGYIMAVADSELGVEWCPPSNVTLRQVFDLTKRMLETLPDKRHENASYFVSASIRNAWPCPKQKKGTTL